MKTAIWIVVSGIAAWAMLACGGDMNASDTAPKVARTDIQQGRYLVMVGGCNDCHTVGFAESGGKAPAEREWLTGSPVGFNGPWGTSYASNLRLYVEQVSEDAWVTMCRTREGLPPMPWPSLHNMDESDLRALYRYLKDLGPAGRPAPTAVAPGVEPATPYFVFVPQHLDRLGAAPSH